MSLSRPARLSMFALLYFAQGAVLSYFTALNALYLLSFDLTMSQIGIIGTIGMIPFVLKIFLGMLSDRVNLFGLGHRKPFIIIGLAVQFLCLLFVPLINPGTQYGLFALTAFLMMTGMALYDTCTDGLALDTTPKEEEGTIQGFMVGGRAMGLVVISGVIGILVQQVSWNVAFYTLAGLTLLPLPFVLRIKEGERKANQQFQWKAFSAFTKPAVYTLAILGALYSLVIYGASEIVNPYLNTMFQMDYSSAGLLTAVLGIGMVIGSVAGGKFTDRIGQRRSVEWAIAVSFIAILALGFIQSSWMAWVLVGLFGLAYGYYDVVYFAVSMSKTDPRIAASMFSILMAVANIGTGIGLALVGGLVDSVGYPLTFAIIAGLNLLALPLLPAVFGKRQKVAEFEIAK